MISGHPRFTIPSSLEVTPLDAVPTVAAEDHECTIDAGMGVRKRTKRDGSGPGFACRNGDREGAEGLLESSRHSVENADLTLRMAVAGPVGTESPVRQGYLGLLASVLELDGHLRFAP